MSSSVLHINIRKVEIEFPRSFSRHTGSLSCSTSLLKIHSRVNSHNYVVIGRKWRCSAAWNNWNATQYVSSWEAQVGYTPPAEFYMIYASFDEFPHIKKCWKIDIDNVWKYLRLWSWIFRNDQHQVKNDTLWWTFSKSNEGWSRVYLNINRKKRITSTM